MRPAHTLLLPSQEEMRGQKKRRRLQNKENMLYDSPLYNFALLYFPPTILWRRGKGEKFATIAIFGST